MSDPVKVQVMDEYEEHSERSDVPTERIEVEAERTKVKVGVFEADLNATGYGSITLDGKPLKVVRMLVECEPEKLPKVQLDLLCTPDRK